MKTVLLVLFKITEIFLAFLLVWAIAYAFGYFAFLRWLEELVGAKAILFASVSIMCYCFYNLMKDGYIKGWINLNKEWVNNIVKRNNK